MHAITELNDPAVASQWTPRLLFRVLRGIVIAALTITCACLAGGMADGQQPRWIATAAPYRAITDGTQLQTDDRFYRNIPGGYLHQGPCQPSWTAPGLRAAKSRRRETVLRDTN